MMDLPANPGPAEPGFAAEVAAAFAWWRDAGIEGGFHDAPTDWLRPREAAAPTETLAAAEVERPAPAAPAIDHSDWPQDLAAFAAWWLIEPSLDGGRVVDRVAPRGPAHAAVMILVPEPEKEDREFLLSGPQGRLLDAMLSAMGLSRDEAYVASALTRHTPHADWTGIMNQGMAEVLAHHIALVSPRRLIAFGSSILPLLGHASPHSAETSGEFNHVGGSVPLLADRDLGALLERPRWKAGFWRRWLDWAG